MAQRRFFDSVSAEKQNKQDENLKATVKEAIADFLKGATEANLCHWLFYALQAVDKDKWTAFESKDLAERAEFFAKTILTGTAWSFFFISKNMARQSVIGKNYTQFKNNEITFQQCLVNILSSFIGHEDLHSFKYKLLKELFGLTANSHEEAKKMVYFTIEILKDDQNLELQSTSNTSATPTFNRRYSDSE